MNEIRFADTKRFVHETIDGETVVLDSMKGHLFLLTGLGPWLWHRMQRGGTFDEVINEVSSHFGSAATEPTSQFLGSLLEAEMLQSQKSGAEAPEKLPYPDHFVPPVVERYDDIADIITMDPIHEVDPAKGWPRRMGTEKDTPKR